MPIASLTGSMSVSTLSGLPSLIVTRVIGCPRCPPSSSRPFWSSPIEIHEPCTFGSALTTRSTLKPGNVSSASAGVPAFCARAVTAASSTIEQRAMCGLSMSFPTALTDHRPRLVEHLGVGRRVAEMGPVLEGPHDPLVAAHFDDLGIVLARVAVAKDDVAIRQHLERGHPRQLNPLQVVLVDFPHGLLTRCYFQDGV